ncbi:ferritin-like domain-containing protein [Nocardia brevicatena]|uniref:ferritin-like domain-containing protein n=1 Tax=Nocardia brevicatena TaxID=37327 RepID=UPI001FE1927D|nr:ferritin-like domain-containing protein [Nocardia brevicatena]
MTTQAHALTAGQQYPAAAVYFEVQCLPQLSAHCCRRGEEHRGHTLRIVQYLLDRELEVTVGGLDEVRPAFESPYTAVAFLSAGEETLAEQVGGLARLARECGTTSTNNSCGGCRNSNCGMLPECRRCRR